MLEGLFDPAELRRVNVAGVWDVAGETGETGEGGERGDDGGGE